MTKSIFYFLMFFTLVPTFFYGQPELDSLKNLLKTDIENSDIYFEIAQYYYHKNYDSSLFYCKKSIEFIDTNNSYDVATTYLLLGICNKNIGNHNNSVQNFKTAKRYFQKDNNVQGIAAIDNNLARLYQQIGDFDKALSFYFQSLQNFEKINDTANLADVFSNIGELYVETNNYEEALKFFNTSKKYYKKANIPRGEGFVLSDLGSVYQKQKKFAEAINFYKQSAEIWKKEDRPKETGEVYIKLSETYRNIEKYSQSLYYCKLAYKLFDESQYSFGKAKALIGIGDYYSIKNKPSIAIVYYQKVLNEKLNENSYVIRIDVYEKLHTTYKLLNNSELALLYIEKEQHLKDSVFNIEQAKNLTNLKIKYDLNSKEAEISNLKKNAIIKQLELENKTAEAQKRTIFLIFSIIIALGLGFFVVVFFYQYKQKNKLSKELFIRVEEREILLKELHHRVKNNLQIIASLLNLQKNHSKNLSIDEILETSRNRITSILSIHEKLYKSDNLKSINLSEYIIDLSENLNQTLNKDNKKINFQIKIDDIKLEINKAIPLGLILNELITNSFKHAFDNTKQPTISILSKKENSFCNIVYSDNGKGLPKDFDIKKLNSLGMKLIAGMTKQMKGTLLTEKNNIGIKFIIKFKHKIDG